MANPPRASKSQMFDSIGGCERPVVFARRVGITSAELHGYIKRFGMPVEPSGYVNVVRGEAWLSNYRKARARKTFVASGDTVCPT